MKCSGPPAVPHWSTMWSGAGGFGGPWSVWFVSLHRTTALPTSHRLWTRSAYSLRLVYSPWQVRLASANPHDLPIVDPQWPIRDPRPGRRTWVATGELASCRRVGPSKSLRKVAKIARPGKVGVEGGFFGTMEPDQVPTTLTPPVAGQINVLGCWWTIWNDLSASHGTFPWRQQPVKPARPARAARYFTDPDDVKALIQALRRREPVGFGGTPKSPS